MSFRNHCQENAIRGGAWRRICEALFVGTCWFSVVSCSGDADDTSCHNLFRYDQSFADPELIIFIPLEIHEWPDFVSLMKNYAGDEHLDFKDASMSGKDFRVLEVRLCDESGLRIEALEQRWRSKDFKDTIGPEGVQVVFYVRDTNVDPRTVWPAPAADLLQGFRDEWPQRDIRFVGPDGSFIAESEAMGDDFDHIE